MSMTRGQRLVLLTVSCRVFAGCGSDPYVGVTVGDAGRPLAIGGADASTRDLPLAVSDAGASGTDTLGTYALVLVPPRKLDLVFMIDNSPSMAPKQDKMILQLSTMLSALKHPTDGKLPDLRLALITSDLGTGGSYPTGACGPKNGAVFGDQGRFQMINATACGVTSPDSLFLEYRDGAPVNFVGALDQVFACLAKNIGTSGCGMEHSLQAFEFALAVKGVGNDEQQATFLRPDALLGLVFLTDEDDCSAAPNDGMFGASPGGTDLSAEAPSLRCYTRSHRCGGANLADTGPGYPTSQALSAPLVSCAARTDACPSPPDGEASTDTSLPTTCSPLRSIKGMADHIKALKKSADLIAVAGIFGWPADGVEAGSAVYRIDLTPNPAASVDPAHPVLFDSWPVCYDPNHKPATNAFDVTAAGWGATAGLRNSAFVDEFGENGFKYSICEADFARAMAGIGGNMMGFRPSERCLPDVLEDADPATPGLQPDCKVEFVVPSVDSSGVTTETSRTLPRCPADSTDGRVADTCWRLTLGDPQCANGQMVAVLQSAVEGSAIWATGTQLRLQCRICPACDPATM